MEKIIRTIIAEILHIDESEVVAGALLTDDLGVDSLDSTELLMALEDEFSIEIPEEDAEKLKTVRDITHYIEKKV